MIINHPALDASGSALLFVRSIFDGKNNETCEAPRSNDAAKELAIGITVQKLFYYIVAACLGITALSGLFLIWQHLHRYTRPMEQRQAVRVVALPCIFCILAFLSIKFYEDAIYIEPIMDVYEAFCVAGLFLLFVEYVCPDEAARSSYFNGVHVKNKNGLHWYKSTMANVMQYPLTRTIKAIIQIATQAAGVYCANSTKAKYAHIWLTVFDTVVSTIALLGLIRFYKQFKKTMDPHHRPLAKLISLKGLVFLGVVQNILLTIIYKHAYTPSRTFTYDDMNYGLYNLLTALECVLFSIFFYYAWGAHHYHERERTDGSKRMPVWKAAFDAMNPLDIVKGVIHSITHYASGGA